MNFSSSKVVKVSDGVVRWILKLRSWEKVIRGATCWINWSDNRLLQYQGLPPDRPFHNYSVSNPDFGQFRTALSLSVDGWRSSKFVKGLVGVGGKYMLFFCCLLSPEESFVCASPSFVTELPDWPFHNFGASRSGDRNILCSSGTSCDQKVVEGGSGHPIRCSTF